MTEQTLRKKLGHDYGTYKAVKLQLLTLPLLDAVNFIATGFRSPTFAITQMHDAKAFYDAFKTDILETPARLVGYSMQQFRRSDLESIRLRVSRERQIENWTIRQISKKSAPFETLITYDAYVSNNIIANAITQLHKAKYVESRTWYRKAHVELLCYFVYLLNVVTVQRTNAFSANVEKNIPLALFHATIYELGRRSDSDEQTLARYFPGTLQSYITNSEAFNRNYAGIVHCPPELIAYAMIQGTRHLTIDCTRIYPTVYVVDLSIIITMEKLHMTGVPQTVNFGVFPVQHLPKFCTHVMYTKVKIHNTTVNGSFDWSLPNPTVTHLRLQELYVNKPNDDTLYFMAAEQLTQLIWRTAPRVQVLELVEVTLPTPRRVGLPGIPSGLTVTNPKNDKWYKQSVVPRAEIETRKKNGKPVDQYVPLEEVRVVQEPIDYRKSGINMVPYYSVYRLLSPDLRSLHLENVYMSQWTLATAGRSVKVRDIVDIPENSPPDVIDDLTLMTRDPGNARRGAMMEDISVFLRKFLGTQTPTGLIEGSQTLQILVLAGDKMFPKLTIPDIQRGYLKSKEVDFRTPRGKYVGMVQPVYHVQELFRESQVASGREFYLQGPPKEMSEDAMKEWIKEQKKALEPEELLDENPRIVSPSLIEMRRVKQGVYPQTLTESVLGEAAPRLLELSLLNLPGLTGIDENAVLGVNVFNIENCPNLRVLESDRLFFMRRLLSSNPQVQLPWVVQDQSIVTIPAEGGVGDESFQREVIKSINNMNTKQKQRRQQIEHNRRLRAADREAELASARASQNLKNELRDKFASTVTMARDVLKAPFSNAISNDGKMRPLWKAFVQPRQTVLLPAALTHWYKQVIGASVSDDRLMQLLTSDRQVVSPIETNDHIQYHLKSATRSLTFMRRARIIRVIGTNDDVLVWQRDISVVLDLADVIVTDNEQKVTAIEPLFPDVSIELGHGMAEEALLFTLDGIMKLLGAQCISALLTIPPGEAKTRRKWEDVGPSPDRLLLTRMKLWEIIMNLRGRGFSDAARGQVYRMLDNDMCLYWLCRCSISAFLDDDAILTNIDMALRTRIQALLTWLDEFKMQGKDVAPLGSFLHSTVRKTANFLFPADRSEVIEILPDTNEGAIILPASNVNVIPPPSIFLGQALRREISINLFDQNVALRVDQKELLTRHLGLRQVDRLLSEPAQMVQIAAEQAAVDYASRAPASVRLSVLLGMMENEVYADEVEEDDTDTGGSDEEEGGKLDQEEVAGLNKKLAEIEEEEQALMHVPQVRKIMKPEHVENLRIKRARGAIENDSEDIVTKFKQTCVNRPNPIDPLSAVAYMASAEQQEHLRTWIEVHYQLLVEMDNVFYETGDEQVSMMMSDLYRAVDLYESVLDSMDTANADDGDNDIQYEADAKRIPDTELYARRFSDDEEEEEDDDEVELYDDGEDGGTRSPSSKRPRMDLGGDSDVEAAMPCVVCATPTTLACPGCNTSYCSNDHAIKHISAHQLLIKCKELPPAPQVLAPIDGVVVSVDRFARIVTISNGKKRSDVKIPTNCNLITAYKGMQLYKGRSRLALKW